MDDGRDQKREKPDTKSFNGEGSNKRNKQEMESSFTTTGIGSKLKPCTKFSSTTGCHFGNGYVPGGIIAVAEMKNLGSNQAGPSPKDPTSPKSSTPCNYFNSAEGCRFGDKCYFSHGEREIERSYSHIHEQQMVVGPWKNRMTNLGSNQAGPSPKHPTAPKSSTPCNYFNSAEGCRFGDKCHFSHGEREIERSYAHIHEEQMVVDPWKNRMTNLGSNQEGPSPKNPTAPKSSTPHNNFNSAEGCTFRDKCHFCHREREIARSYAHIHEEQMVVGPSQRTMLGGKFPGRIERPPPPQAPGIAAAAANFGSKAKSSVNASLVGVKIGKGGMSPTQICRLTGAKLTIREHKSDPNLNDIELEGSFDQIKQASAMVRGLMVNVGSTIRSTAAPGPNYKTKLCEHHTIGFCPFRERCHFAHGLEELRK